MRELQKSTTKDEHILVFTLSARTSFFCSSFRLIFSDVVPGLPTVFSRFSRPGQRDRAQIGEEKSGQLYSTGMFVSPRTKVDWFGQEEDIWDMKKEEAGASQLAYAHQCGKENRGSAPSVLPF